MSGHKVLESDLSLLCASLHELNESMLVFCIEKDNSYKRLQDKHSKYKRDSDKKEFMKT
jgi:hypothetical protein